MCVCARRVCVVCVCLHHMGRYFFPSHCQGTGPRMDTQTLTKALGLLGGGVGCRGLCMCVCVCVHLYRIAVVDLCSTPTC